MTAEDSSIQSSDAEGRCAYILLYDVDVENGFPEQESAAVTFVNEHELFDISTVDVLSWRMEGSDWEPPPSSADFSIDGERVCNLDDMIKEGEMIERYACILVILPFFLIDFKNGTPKKIQPPQLNCFFLSYDLIN